MSGILCILRGPSKVLKEVPEPERWCFHERKRRTGKSVLLGDEQQPSYYDPQWVYRCAGCGGDYRLGFGRCWE